MPPESTVRNWVTSDTDGFSKRYRDARVLLHDHWADEIVEIADDGSGDAWIDQHGRVHVNRDIVKRSELRVDTRKWLLSKLHPENYGDRVTAEHVGRGGGPIQHQHEHVVFYVPTPARAVAAEATVLDVSAMPLPTNGAQAVNSAEGKEPDGGRSDPDDNSLNSTGGDTR